MDNISKHTLNIDSNGTVVMTAVFKVDSLTANEATVTCDIGKVVVKGSGLVLQDLDSTNQKVSIVTDKVYSITYSGNGAKTNWKALLGR